MYTSEALFIARKWTGKQNSRNKKQQRELKKEIADANCIREKPAASESKTFCFCSSSKQQQTKGNGSRKEKKIKKKIRKKKRVNVYCA
jgi:hypothetical protein